jgi:hypothetical protein
MRVRRTLCYLPCKFRGESSPRHPASGPRAALPVIVYLMLPILAVVIVENHDNS